MAFELLPRCAAIGGFIYPTAWTAAGKTPRSPHFLIQRGIKHVRICRRECHIDRARFVVPIENLLPRLPCVGRAEYAALFVWSIRVANRRNKNNIRIVRID